MMLASPQLKTINSKTLINGMKNANKTKTESCTFIKHLIAISVSNILFLREVFSDDNFEQKEFEGLTIRFLKQKPVYQGAEVFNKWLKGAFEAVEMKYLRHLVLEIKDSNGEKTLELYTMSFNYDEGKESMSLSYKSGNQSKSAEKSKFTLSDLQAKTVQLIRLCHAVTKKCSSLPPTVSLLMRLSYNDHTPDSYQPEGYKLCNALTFQFPCPPRKIEIGIVETKFHSFKLISKSCLMEDGSIVGDDDLEDEIENGLEARNENENGGFFQPEKDSSQHSLEEICNRTSRQTLAPTNLDFTNQENENFQTTQKEVESGSETDVSETLLSKRANDLRLDEDEENILTEPFLQEDSTVRRENFSQSAFAFPDIDTNGISSQEREKILKCVCTFSKESSSIIRCSLCRRWSHPECYGFMDKTEWENVEFFCVECHGQTQSAICQDYILLERDASTRERLASFRRILHFCYNFTGKLLTVNRMEKVLDLEEKSKLFGLILRKLLDTGIVKTSNRKNSYPIDREVLNERIPHYFYIGEEYLSNPETAKRKRRSESLFTNLEDFVDKSKSKKRRASETAYQKIVRNLADTL